MRIVKILCFLLLLAALLCGSAILSLASLFMGKPGAILLIWPAALTILLLAGTGLFGWFSRPLRLGMTAVLGVCVLIGGSWWVYQAWDDSFRTVKDEVDLWDYRPFAGKSRLAALAAPSTLKLTTDLPRLDGATALYPLYAAIVQATYPVGDYDYSSDPVQCSKTTAAWERLMAGEADAIFVARPSQKQTEAAKARGLELQLTPIGREAFVFFVNARNPVNELSVSQIQDIYSGKLTDWRSVGGEDGTIKAFQRPEGSGSQTMLQKTMEGKTLIPAPQADVVQGMGGIIRHTANYKNYRNAIGYSFLFFATEMVKNDEIRLLTIDGIAPSRQSIRDKTYPFSADLYAATIKGHETPQTRALIEWVLAPQGQELIDKTGYVPLN